MVSGRTGDSCRSKVEVCLVGRLPRAGRLPKPFERARKPVKRRSESPGSLPGSAAGIARGVEPHSLLATSFYFGGTLYHLIPVFRPRAPAPLANLRYNGGNEIAAGGDSLQAAQAHGGGVLRREDAQSDTSQSGERASAISCGLISHRPVSPRGMRFRSTFDYPWTAWGGGGRGSAEEAPLGDHALAHGPNYRR